MQGRTTITKRDLEEAQNLLPGRSTAAIKKKYLEIKNPNQAEKQNTNKWSEAELDELVRAYKSRPEPLATARIRAICDNFPNRTQKAIAAKLRESYPDVYYMRNTNPETDSDDVPDEETPQEQSNAGPTPALDLLEEEEQNHHHRHQELAEHEEHIFPEQQPQPGAHHNAVPSTSLAGHETEGEEGYAQPPIPRMNQPARQEPLCPKIKAYFDKLLRHVSDKKPKIKRFLIRPQNKKTVKLVDAVLEDKILEILAQASTTDREKRKAVKNAIYVATKVLRESLVTKKPVKPAHKRTEEQIKRLNTRINIANEIRNSHGQNLSKRLHKQVKIIKRLKMSVKDYIISSRERLAILEKKLDRQKTRDEASAIRRRFYERPTIEVLQETPRPQDKLKADDAEKFYRGLYSRGRSDDQKPVFGEWLRKIKRFSSARNFDQQTSPDYIKEKCNEALARAAPWKAAGDDGIPNYAYKILPAARNYLVTTTQGTLTGKLKLNETDVRARLVLIYKKGDEQDPENYRPISILNTDYKIVTAVITATLKEALPNWAIPPEQFAQNDIWGTTHGLLEDKSITTLARKRNTKNYSAWYDFRKAFDSVHHSCLKRLIDALPLHQHIKQATKLAIKLWSLRIQLGKTRTAPIPVRRGILQGDSMSPLLFTLVTAALINHVNTGPDILKQTKGKHRILAYMDDIKCHAPTKTSLKTITDALKKAAAEIGLALNTDKCGHYSRTEEVGDGELEPFLPQVRQGYKYLGLVQLEKDTEQNYKKIEEQLEDKLQLVFASQLTTSQKVALLNSTIIPAVTYVTANIFSDEKRSTTLKRCRDLDKNIRKKLVEHKLKGKSSSNASVYLPLHMGGLGITSIERTTEIAHAKKGIYLLKHGNLEKCRERYRVLQKAGWRNPLTDMERVLNKYGVDIPAEEDIKRCCQQVSKAIKEKITQSLREEWCENMHYGRLVVREEKKLTIPAHTSPNLDSWRRTMLLNAEEHNRGATPWIVCGHGKMEMQEGVQGG